MIFLPTRGRPKSLERFINQYHETGAILPITVILDNDDAHRYESVVLPEHWIKRIAPYSRKLNQCLNDCFNDNPNKDFYGIVCDDCMPRTPNWDVKLADAAGNHFIAWPDDGVHQERMCGFSYIGGDLVRAWGWYCSPIVNRGCVDFIWGDFGDELGLKRYQPDILLEHLHWQIQDKDGKPKAPYDATYATQPSVREDVRLWQQYRTSEQFRKDVQDVKEKLGL